MKNANKNVNIIEEEAVFVESMNKIEKAIFNGFNKEVIYTESENISDGYIYKLAMDELETTEECLEEAGKIIKNRITKELWELKEAIKNDTELQENIEDKSVITGDIKDILYGKLRGNEKFEDSKNPSLKLLTHTPRMIKGIIEDVKTMVNIYVLVTEQENSE